MLASSPAPAETSVLELDELVVGFQVDKRTAVTAVRNVSLSVERGQTLGIVGESGSGKSVSLLGAFGLLPGNGRQLGGTARFNGRDISTMSDRERRALLGKDVAFVFQNPISSLDPVLSIGDQLVEALRIHDRRIDRRAAEARAVELLTQVGIVEPERRLRQFPHEFSGGMSQRVMIAMALANKPQLLIADEPTTAVDATIQAQILTLLREVRSEVSGAVVLVSHDLGVIAENTERLVVMYAGRVMESGDTDKILADPQHPYTQGLLSCRPSLYSTARLEPIPGQPPSIARPMPGCPFQPRCPLGKDKEICGNTAPELQTVGASQVACHFAGTKVFSTENGEARTPRAASEASPLFALEGIKVEFPVRNAALFQPRRVMRAVDDVSIKLFPGEALGVVGESGSGKSTLARVMMRLIDPTAGSIKFAGNDITHLGRDDLRSFRNRVQMVFQDPLNSLNPRLSVGDNAAEPLRLRGVSAAERRAKVVERFAEVGLEPAHYDRSVGEMSGGQLQRAGIARALVLDPEVLIMDEPVSALDVSVQAQILNLLSDLKASRNLSYVFISHDMAVVRYLCDRVAVMHLGKLVEVDTSDAIFDNPQQDYTRKLLSAVPEVRTTTAAN
jgi:peptide/nickel transport system ATP-binding protein